MEGIIVVDKIPKNCQECGMYYTSAIGGFGCVVSHRFISQNAANKRKKPDWCPIKPIPMREESGLGYSVEKRKQAIKDLEAGMKTKEVAKKYGVTPETIRNWKKKIPEREMFVEESERLKGVVEYMNGATFKQVAKNHGVTECAVRYWVKKYAPKVYAQNMQKKKPCIQQEEVREKRKTKLIFIKCTSNSGYFKRKMV